jgi:hypothetical protein
MGMMKEHVHGLIRCRETLARDILLQVRPEELVHNRNFHAIHMKQLRRGNDDNFGGVSAARFLIALLLHTSIDMLRLVLKQVLEELPGNRYTTCQQPTDYGNEDLVILEHN